MMMNSTTALSKTSPISLSTPGSSTNRKSARKQVVVQAMRNPNKADAFKENFRRGPLDDIGSYVSEAFAQIFTGLDEAEQVPWIEQPAFSGSIAHHEVGTRHGHASGGHSPMYYDGGFDKKYEVIRDDDHLHGEGPLGWITDSVGRSFFGTNLSEGGGSVEPRKYYSTGYSGRKASARRVRREVDRLGRH